MATNKDFSEIILHILQDVRVELDDAFDRNFERQAFFAGRSPLGLRESMLINCSGHDRNISLRLFGWKSIFISDMSLVAQYSIIKY